VVTKFESWVYLIIILCNKRLVFDLLFEIRGVKIDKSNFGKSRVAQIVTAVHRHLSSCMH